MIARLLFFIVFAGSMPAFAQQAVRLPVDAVQLTTQLYRPAAPGRVPAVEVLLSA